MLLIGILTESGHDSYLKEELKEILKKEHIFFLKESNMQNLKNIKFQVLLIGKKVLKNKEEIREIIKKADYVILNADIIENLDLLNNLDVQLITYGFNQKATITASSVEENKIMICLQRTIKNLQNKKIEPQEFKRKLIKDSNTYAVMELVSLLLLYKQWRNIKDW